MSDIHTLPLPEGWVKQTHESGHPYYVDTRANPPRSIWVHPYEDEQYLSEHPEAREKKVRHSSVDAPPPPFNGPRHSYDGQVNARGTNPNNQPQRKRGFFGKLKDKAIGTKEEREAERQRIATLQAQRRQQMMAQRASYGPQYQYAQQPQYGAPHGPSPYGYGPQPGMGMGMGGRRGGLGGGGMALPLLGGMAGGLLLGSALDNDHGYDDYGGGDYGGGFGDGGGFDGGGFD